MFYFVVLSFVILVGLVAALFFFAQKAQFGAISTLVATALLAIGVTGVFSATMVDHREVAVVTAFGKYQETISTGGLHWIKPWASVEKFDQTIQTAEVVDVSVSFSDGGGEDGLQEVGGGKGLIDATVRWQVTKDQENEGAKALWEKYRTFDTVRDSLVTRATRDTVINIANSYPASTAIISQQEIAEAMNESLTAELKPYGITVDSVSVPAIDLEAGTQASVDKLFTTQQDIKRAQNEQLRAEIDAETVEIREQSGALSPAANQRFCLDIVNAWDTTKNGVLPATFNCNFGGEQQEVIVNAP